MQTEHSLFSERSEGTLAPVASPPPPTPRWAPQGAEPPVDPNDEDRRADLSRRLALAVALPIVALVSLGAILGLQIVRMSEDATWLDHSDQVISAAHETLRHVIDQETAVRGYLLTRERPFLEPFERARPREGFDRLQALVADNPAQQARFGEARRSYDVWSVMAASVVEHGDVAAESQLGRMTERKALMDRLRVDMQAAVEVEQGLRATRLAKSQASTSFTLRIFAALLALVAVLLAVLSRRQLGAIAKTFASALASERSARADVEREAWIREGQARVSGALQGEQGTPQLGMGCLNTLVAYAQADVAAFFVRDGSSWKRRAAVALDSRSAGPDTFLEGEGIIGRAAVEGGVINLRDLPASFMALRSGTGEMPPAQVVVVPAAIAGRTHAVVELGFRKPAEARAVELLHRIRESVAIAVRSAEANQRVRELLEQTQRQAEALQAQQEELRVQNEELEQQSQSLQQSQAQLESQQAELELSNTQLEEQTQLLQRQRDALALSQREIIQANEYKSEFLANMSHELRTPLNSSLILAKLLADNRKGNLDAEQVKFAQTIYSAGNDLLFLINDILDLSKIEAGKLEVRLEDVSLGLLLDDLLNTFQPIARDKQLELSMKLEQPLPSAIHSDPTRLQQILKNLLSNALKFTERGGVSLTIRQAGSGTIQFDVKDTGIGISADQHKLIFEPFRQADGTTNRKYGGTGLGLSISRDLAHRLGGELTLQSAPGRGSTFTLRLPERYTLQADSEQAGAEQSGPPRAQREVRAQPSQSPGETVASTRAGLPATGGRSLLIIEDDEQFSSVVAGVARELEFDVVTAANAADGLAAARRQQPSAIILDVKLPDRSGLSVLDALKHDPATRHIPVHLMSASDHTRTALEMGAAGYAIKPVAREGVLQALQGLELRFTRSLKRVLIVEDDEVHRASTCHLLSGSDVEAIPVGTAQEALEQLSSTTFDCMVLDLSLPDQSGFELLARMASHDRYGFPPVIVYTGRTLSVDEERELRRFSQSIIIKGARSPERLLDEVTLFLHQVESELPPERQRMLRAARDRDAAFEGRTVLLVEDDVRNIFAITSILEPLGAKLEIARNGKEALSRLAANPNVHLVLMDIMMPEMDGLQTMREIRKQPRFSNLSIIALTAKAMADDREDCLAAGANDYIAKPLDVDKLLSLSRVWMPKST